jgi:hypothetical protein
MRGSSRAVIIALGVAYGAIVALAVGYVQERNTLESLRSQISADRRMIESSTASTPAATPPISLRPSTMGVAYARIQSLSDNLGNVWTPGAAVPPQASLSGGAVVTLVAHAEGPAGQSLQYKFWTGQAPQPIVLCDWAGSTCTWSTTQLPQNCTGGGCAAQITVAVRLTVGQPRLADCFQAEGCDDMIQASYSWHSS